jgi:hypothetical protein
MGAASADGPSRQRRKDAEGRQQSAGGEVGGDVERDTGALSWSG